MTKDLLLPKGIAQPWPALPCTGFHLIQRCRCRLHGKLQCLLDTLHNNAVSGICRRLEGSWSKSIEDEAFAGIKHMSIQRKECAKGLSQLPACRRDSSAVLEMQGHQECQGKPSCNTISVEGLPPRMRKHLSLLLGLAALLQSFLRQATPKEFQSESSPVKGAMRSIRMAAVVVPFASVGMGGTAFLVTRAIASFLQTYLLLLFLRVLLSWFPTFNWERQPWLTLRQMTDPYLQLFRGLIPPLLGMIDFTPLLGFFVLQYISGELQSVTMEGDLEEFW